MLYRVFNTQEEVFQANQNWITARANAGIRDTRLGVEVTPQITTCWDMGLMMLDGRYACQVPDMFSDAFVGLELELSDEQLVILGEDI